MIHYSTRALIGIYIFCGILFVGNGCTYGAVVCFIAAAITACWYGCVQKLIEFAGANLSVACDGASQFPTLFIVAFAALAMNIVWVVFWGFAMIGVAKPSEIAVVDMSGVTYESSLCYDYAKDALMRDNEYCTSEAGCCDCASSDGSNLVEKDGACINQTMTQITYCGMLISFYWGSSVISNVMHCVTAGAIASWWFKSDVGSTPVFDSFYRAMTTR